MCANVLGRSTASIGRFTCRLGKPAVRRARYNALGSFFVLRPRGTVLYLLIPSLLAQIGGATVDSVYATPALRSLVEHAALVNRSGPVSLSGYRASLESEISVLVV